MSPDSKTNYAIVGAGPAAIIAAETLRNLDAVATITVIGDEPEPPYSRMALPYYLVGNITAEGTYLRKSNTHFSDKHIDIVRDRVIGVDTAKKTLQLAAHESMTYDKLLLATGSHPLQPKIDGIDSDGVYPCWTLQDSHNIIKRANPGSKVVLMGAGFIGCIILEALATRGVELTVVERGAGMVPRMMDNTAGSLLKHWCLEKGVKVLTDTSAVAISSGNTTPLQLHLANDTVLAADLIISATGVAANIDFLATSAIETDFGVLVNDRLQSSVTDVYAAGDVCQGKDFSTGQYNVQAIQPTAAEHGRIAAMNMAGRDVVHQGCVNMNVLDTLGLISSSYGLWMGQDSETAMLCDKSRYRYLNLQFQDDVLIGAQALGLTQHVGVLRGLIQSRLKLGKWKQKLLADPTRIMEAYLANTQAIGHNAGVI